jgi:hypothetical protein
MLIVVKAERIAAANVGPSRTVGRIEEFLP